MANQVSLSAALHNFEDCLALAHDYGLGIELMAFSVPAILDGDWRGIMKHYRRALVDLPGPLTMHGPFMDLVSGSPDERMNDLTYGRYEHAIRIASALGARQVVFHANYIGSLHNDFYRQGWHQRNIDFWGPLGDYAKAYGVVVAVENMWEYDPAIIGNLLHELDHPFLQCCLDIGHAYLFSDPDITIDDWLNSLGDCVNELHLNNNNGDIDEHHGFDWVHGVINYKSLLPRLRQLPNQPLMVLEMDSVRDMKDSLHYLDLDS